MLKILFFLNVFGSEKRLKLQYFLNPSKYIISLLLLYVASQLLRLELLRAQEVTGLNISSILRKNNRHGWDEKWKNKNNLNLGPQIVGYSLNRVWGMDYIPYPGPPTHNLWQSIHSVISHPGGQCSVYVTLYTQMKI